MLEKALDFAKSLTLKVLRPGALAIDATVGNGHDTLFLAEQVGLAGRVFGFDVQEEALATARRRLVAAGMAERVHLFQDGHEYIAERLPGNVQGKVSAVMFNLGYLPGGDKTFTTRPNTTCRALEAGCRVLAPGGLITVVLYTGHQGGAEEAHVVRDWASCLDPAGWQALSYQLLNQTGSPPSLLVIERKDADALIRT